MLTLRTLACGILALGVCHARPAVAEPHEASALGAKVDDFALADAYGKEHHLSNYADRPVVVLAFLGTECPLARLYAPRLVALAKKYGDQGVVFLGISSNAQDNVTELKNFARANGIEFPILKDLNNALADRLHATRTPAVYLLDRQRVVRYKGRIDDQYGLQDTKSGTRVSYQLKAPRREDLAQAIDELLAGKSVSVAQTEPTGCLIGRRKQANDNSKITYSKHIARLLNEHCVLCHRPGQIGPFSLTSYEDAAGWAEMIGEVVAEQRMPPWHADPKYGKFADDPRLSAEEKGLIAEWIAAGAPRETWPICPRLPSFPKAG